MIDSRLLEGSHLIATWSVCDIRLKDNAQFPWLILIPRIPDITEVFQLDEKTQLQLMQEISLAAKLFNQYTQADKINIATIGNQVPQLHIHVVARFINDSLWPQSIWQNDAPDSPYSESEFEQHIQLLCQLFSQNPSKIR